MTRKVVEMFGKREEAERSARVRNTVEASGAGQGTSGVFGRPGTDAADCSGDKAGALAEMVLDHREGLGLSQREFAKESGVSRTILSKVERGELYPGGKVRRKLAAAIGRPPMDLWRIGPDAVDTMPEDSQEKSRNGFSGSERETERQEHRAAS